MSVYQGFPTRQQETLYFKLIDKVLQLLTKKCLNLIQIGKHNRLKMY